MCILKHPCPKCPKHPWTSEASNSIFYQCKPCAFTYKTVLAVLVLIFRLYFFLSSKGGLFLLFSQNSWSPLSYHLLDLHSHSLFHLQLFPLSANILGLLYPKNKQNTNKNLPSTLRPSPISSFLLPFPHQISCLPVCLCTSEATLSRASMPSFLLTFALSYQLMSAALGGTGLLLLLGHPASLALPYPGLLPSFFFPIVSLPLSLALFISPSSHRYSPKFHTCLFPFPLLALWVHRVSFSHCSNFLLYVDYSSNWYLYSPFPPGYLNSSTNLFPVPLILVMSTNFSESCMSLKKMWVPVLAQPPTSSKPLDRALWVWVSSSVN